MPGRVLHELSALWRTREPRDEYMGTLVNAYLAAGGRAIGVRAGEAYVDVGTLNGYREAIRLLTSPHSGGALRSRSGNEGKRVHRVRSRVKPVMPLHASGAKICKHLSIQ
jgi:hypothetical protein